MSMVSNSIASRGAQARSLILRRASIALFGALSLFLIAFGILYASVTEMLWFHAAAVPESIRQEVRPLYFALMKLIGGSSSALGLLGGFVLFGPVRGGSTQAAGALAGAFSIPLVMAAYVAETLAARTGAPTSWHIMGVLLAIDAVAYAAFVFARRPSRS